MSTEFGRFYYGISRHNTPIKKSIALFTELLDQIKIDPSFFILIFQFNKKIKSPIGFGIYFWLSSSPTLAELYTTS